MYHYAFRPRVAHGKALSQQERSRQIWHEVGLTLNNSYVSIMFNGDWRRKVSFILCGSRGKSINQAHIWIGEERCNMAEMFVEERGCRAPQLQFLIF